MEWIYFSKYIFRYRKLQTVIIALGLLAIPVSLLNPYFVKLVLDKAYVAKDLKLFFILAVLAGTVFAITAFINSLNDYLSKRIDRYIYSDLSKDIFEHLQRLPLSFFKESSSGGHLYKISSDARLLSSFIGNSLPQIIPQFLQFLTIAVIIFYLNRDLAFFVIIMVFLSCIHPYLFGKWLKELVRKMTEKSEKTFKRMHEVFNHMYLIKAFGKEDYEIEKFKSTLSERLNFEIKNAKLSSISIFSGSLLTKAIAGIVALYGGYEVIKGKITLGSLSAVMIYLTQLIGLSRIVGRFYENFALNCVSAKRLREILDIKPNIIEKTDAVDFPILGNQIEFKNVYFGYKKDELILEGINCLIPQASKIAIVGPSGCGKTTFLSLILRLYDVKKGAVQIDGIDIRNIKLKPFMSQIAVALEEPFLWHDTVANNILYGVDEMAFCTSRTYIKEDDVEMGGVIWAAKITCAHDFIMGLPQQYNTLLGDMACKISEGQKQRIAMARAVVKRPRILILDEAMSSVDSQTEEKIIDNIKKEFNDSTIIIVSHRFSTVKKMDLVYFLRSPSQIDISNDSGTKERDFAYQKLFMSQMQ